MCPNLKQLIITTLAVAVLVSALLAAVSRPGPASRDSAWCDLQSMKCYDRLATRLTP